MSKNRLEAFSDGVIAIIITIMVLEMRAPHGTHLGALTPMWPVFLSYVLSYIFIGIYWSNHHHLLHAIDHVDGRVLWANLHLLFWLTLIPFVTAWMGENHFVPLPVMLYGMVLLAAACAYTILVKVLIRTHGQNSILAEAVGDDFKGKISIISYALAILCAHWVPKFSCALYVAVAVLWLVPDSRIEKTLSKKHA